MKKELKWVFGFFFFAKMMDPEFLGTWGDQSKTNRVMCHLFSKKLKKIKEMNDVLFAPYCKDKKEAGYAGMTSTNLLFRLGM